MLEAGQRGVKARALIHAAATLTPPRATSLRRFVDYALDGLPHDDGLEPVLERQEAWQEEPLSSDPTAAARRLVAEDLGVILPTIPALRERLAAWCEPQAAIETATERAAHRLSELGLDVGEPALHFGEGLPAPYDHPSLSVISIDDSDAAEFGLHPGLHVDTRRLEPFFTECAVAHVLVHVALGRRSPEQLGRGLEEGVAEVLGALHAGAAAVGPDAAESTFAAHRLTPSWSSHREAFLDHVRSAAEVHARHGLRGLVHLVTRGREGIKEVEGALAEGELRTLGLPREEPDRELAACLSRLLGERSRPLAVSALAYFLGCRLEQGCDVRDLATQLGLPPESTLTAAKELMERAFVLVLSDEGVVLVDDLDLVLPAKILRYELPRAKR